MQMLNCKKMRETIQIVVLFLIIDIYVHILVQSALEFFVFPANIYQTLSPTIRLMNFFIQLLYKLPDLYKQNNTKTKK